MAGAGYKLYSTGDVLTASDVNTYIQQQTVMVFADASARTTALSGVVAEGMLTYLKDTDVVQYYSGSGWVTVNTDQTPLTTKGDLFTYSTQDARLAVGNNGETLVADSSATTGLRWQQPKTQNAIYNSGMDIAQRGTSFTAISTNIYTLDRWFLWCTTSGQSNYVSQQSIGNLSVSPNQAIRYATRVGRTNTTTNTGARYFFQTLETADSLRFAGKTITFSFYARRGANYSGSSNVLKYWVEQGTGTDQLYYSFTGTSSVISQTSITLGTGWTRFQGTATVSTSATELAVGFVYEPTGTAGADDWFEITGVQLEEGSVATPYNRMSGTIAGELAACQRYYWKTYLQGTAPATNTSTAIMHFSGGSDGSGNILSTVFYPVTMRTAPTITAYRIDGTSGSWGYERSGASGNGTVSIDLIGDRQTRFYTAVGANWVAANHYGHMIASAEL